MRYWPTLESCLYQLAFDADTAVSKASDPLTAAAIEATRPSLTDFFKTLFAAIKENKTHGCYGQLLQNFNLSDNSLASLANCALNLSLDELKNSLYVRRIRQRLREGATN